MNTVAVSVSHDDLMRLPVRHYEGPVRVIQNDGELARVCDQLRTEPYLGFDTETKPSFRRGQVHPPSLVQLAGGAEVVLFQLRGLSNLRPLASLLADGAVVKVGVALDHDIKSLMPVLGVQPTGMVDLGVVAQRHGIKQLGLRSLAALFLGFRITKGSRTSNWARRELTPAQIRYAATDAWVSRLLYEHFRERRWIV